MRQAKTAEYSQCFYRLIKTCHLIIRAIIVSLEQPMVFDSPTLSSLALIGAGFSAAFIAALWVSLVIWTYRDIRRRSRDPLMRILAMLVVAILFLPGVLVYFILRPPHTLEEEYQRTLEEEALLQTIEDIPLCPGCSRQTQTDWQVCPNCHTRLKKPCHYCGKLMDLSWNLCPYCGSATPGMRREKMTMEDALQTLPSEPRFTPINDDPTAPETSVVDFLQEEDELD
jgi:RNA polymerase subunit RPABC4/transcription elongation factor Spt4